MEAIKALFTRIEGQVLDLLLPVARYCGCETAPYAFLVGLALVFATIWYFTSERSRSIPRITVPLEPAEATNDGVSGRPQRSMKLVDANRPGFIQCYDPATSQKIGEVPIFSASDVNDAVARARKAQEKWCKTSFAERRHVLRILQEYILENQETICRVSARDSGKTMVDACIGEVLTTCEKIRWTVAEGEKWLKPEYRSTSMVTIHKSARIEFHPLGVLGIIAPWNYPFHNIYGHIVSGIFAGNGLVVKVSEHTSWSSDYYLRVIRKVLETAGHDPDLIQIVTGLGATGAALVESDVDKIFFTGSAPVGKLVMAGCAKSLKPVVLELGGKDPVVVCDDADFEQVAHVAMRGTYQNCGQNCVGAERFYVHEKVYEKFVERMLGWVEPLRQGNPLGETVDCGAMCMPGELDRIQSIVDDAVSKGARLLVGGEANTECGPGMFYKPTILADVDHTMRVTQEEMFAPVMVILKWSNDKEVVDMINDCPYGLGSSVYSLNYSRAERIASGIRSGMSNINDFGINYLCQSLPFGGVKDSGFDRFAGVEGLRGSCLMKSVTTDKFPLVRTNIPPMLQYPMKENSFNFVTSLHRLLYAGSIGGTVNAIIDLIKYSVFKTK